MPLVKSACLLVLAAASLLGQLRYLNPSDIGQTTAVPVISTDNAGNTYFVRSGGSSGGTTATKLDSLGQVVYSFSFAPSEFVVSVASVVDSKGALFIG